MTELLKVFVFFLRPGVLKDPHIMSGVWLVIFFIICLILARQVGFIIFQLFINIIFSGF